MQASKEWLPLMHYHSVSAEETQLHPLCLLASLPACCLPLTFFPTALTAADVLSPARLLRDLWRRPAGRRRLARLAAGI